MSDTRSPHRQGSLAAADDASAAPAATARWGLALPAFPTGMPAVALVPAPGEALDEPASPLDPPRRARPTTGQLRRFPLLPELSTLEADERDAASTGETAATSGVDAAPAPPKRPLLPAAPIAPPSSIDGNDGAAAEPSPMANHAPAAPTGYRARRSQPRNRLRELQAALPDSPFVLAGLLLAIGVGVLAWTYGMRLPRPYNYLLFWNALGLCLGGVLLCGLNDHARARHHLTVLAAFGAITWLPHIFRSPDRSLFSDELFHLQIVRQIAELGHNRLPVTFYPIPGEFPGLHFATLALMGATGLSLDWAARLLTLTIHATIPALAYVAARGFGLGRRGAFIAALIYIANTSYYYFHAIFSYETLGVLFVLAVWTLLSRRNAAVIARDLWLAVPLLVALAVTHHFSSYILGITLVIAWIARRLTRRFGPADAPIVADGTNLCTILAVILPIAWAVTGTVRTISYLANSFAARVGSIATGLRAMITQQSQGRALFQGSPLPLAEQLIDFLYVPLLLALTLGGVGLILWRLGLRRAPAVALALAPCGPLAWFLTVPAIFTPASELAYRSWPFLFLGVALFASLALTMVASLVRTAPWPWLAPAGWPIAGAVLALLLFGGISIGDDQAGRFPQRTPTKAAGPEVITPDLIGAARWLEATNGRYGTVVGDGTSQMIFATIGYQKATIWGEWVPFLAPTTGEVSQFMAQTQTRYLIVDRRITSLPPRYGYYFSDAEIYLSTAQTGGRKPDEPLPVALLDKFDRVADLARIYDNGNIQLYERRVPVKRTGRQPLPGVGGDEQPGPGGMTVAPAGCLVQLATLVSLPGGRDLPDDTRRARATAVGGGGG